MPGTLEPIPRRPAPGKPRWRQVCILGSAEEGSRAFDLAGAAGALLARLGITVVSGCGSPATRVAAERALAGVACLVIGGRAGTISEVCLAWLHHRPLLPLAGCGGWSDGLEKIPADERRHSPILPWGSMEQLEGRPRELRLVDP